MLPAILHVNPRHWLPTVLPGLSYGGGNDYAGEAQVAGKIVNSSPMQQRRRSGPQIFAMNLRGFLNSMYSRSPLQLKLFLIWRAYVLRFDSSLTAT